MPLPDSSLQHPWDSKIGWIVPSWNTVTEYEVARMTPPNVSNHFARIAHTEDSEAAFAQMADEAPAAVQLLADARVDAISYTCTAGSFFRGRAADETLGRLLTDRAGRPVVTMADSIVRAARLLGLERLSLAAPYEQWLLEALAAYLREAGFEILTARGLGVQADIRHGLETTVALARSAFNPAADGMVISCGNFRTMEAIETIEDELGMPVVTSIQAAVWAMLSEVDSVAHSSARGSLFRDRTRLG